jgi:hypothetical protein
VETYVDMRKARADRSGSEGSLKLHVMNDQEFAGLKLGRLEAQNILDWRDRLPAALEPSSKNRILNDLRAALNAAAGKYRRQLPAHILAEIKIGTKAESITSSPRRQLLTDEQVRAVVDAAFEVDPISATLSCWPRRPARASRNSPTSSLSISSSRIPV